MKIFFILFYIINTIYGYLTKTNYYCIRNLIKNQNITITQREKVNKILYNSFEKWSMKQAYIFKKKHYYKCSRIPTDELILYSKVGLYKSILNYNGKTDFVYYSSLYIKYELIKAITDSYSLSILPKKIRLESKKNYTLEENKYYMDLLTTKVKSDCNYWKNNKIDLNHEIINTNEYRNKLREMWGYIYTLDAFTKRILTLKYNYEFNIIRSNKEVAKLMCCSEEWIRVNLKKIKKDTNLKKILE